MKIKTAEYTGSYVEVTKCPEAQLPEFAFIGRSNVGKSSLVNSLTGRKKLSKVSVTPGKTQTINFFIINGKMNFVDLPGYGFAKVSKESRAKWKKMIENYLLKRKQLMYVCQLIDARVPPQKIDLEFIEWMGQNQIPFIILFTKADKPGARETTVNVQLFKKQLLEKWDSLPPMFITSAEKNVGKEEVLAFIEGEAAAYMAK
jgi:GTP-binding protein